MTTTYTSSFDLTTEAGVEAYLSDTPYACTRAEALSGGSGNFVFRLHLRQPHSGRGTLVLKHARPYVKVMTNIPLHIERQVRGIVGDAFIILLIYLPSFLRSRRYERYENGRLPQHSSPFLAFVITTRRSM